MSAYPRRFRRRRSMATSTKEHRHISHAYAAPSERPCRSVMPDGNLVQTGGYNDGELKIRVFSPWDVRLARNAEWIGCQKMKLSRTGSAVLLPLMNFQAPAIHAEVLRPPTHGGWWRPCLLARVMGDMILLPNGNVLIINGASSGTAGWEFGRNPVVNPVLYKPDKEIGTRNPHKFYNFTDVLFPTELSLEAFSPAYLDAKFNSIRPTIVASKSMSGIKYGQKLTVQVMIAGNVAQNQVSVTMVAPPFNTHSFSMNQRLLELGNDKVTALEKSMYNIGVTIPRSENIAPAGFYLLFVVHQGIPQ
ncbi:Glyoxal oxidase-related protein [Hibiscus syriacus]|uniref:Glyoxal oxidase-related protein n=1 Tax=Hibiscus syriacus TaxID=106335 RepID=A0A6A3AY00_HIBSY|nr:Glyoxal oxidase-related protein [Hibiscus syriacus]